jgi:DNA-binding response OmpR family regulator
MPEGAGRHEVETAGGGGQPGYLGLILDQGRHKVRRVGEVEEVDLSWSRLMWALLEKLCRSGDYICSRSQLRLVWENIGLAANPEDGTINAAISDLRKELEPLSLKIANCRGTGWMLEEGPRPDRP